MQFFDSPATPSRPISDQSHRFLMSSVNSFNYSQEQATPPPTSHSDRTGRKTYKTTKEKKETVWPPRLEDALLEALTLYRPKSKSGRKLRRFTKRNVFISNHIFKETGVRRTPKQVGSRLQQIRESCQDEKVLKLVCCREFPAGDDYDESPAPSPVKSDVVSGDYRTHTQSPTPRKTPSLSSVSTESDGLHSPVIQEPHQFALDSPSSLSVSVELIPADDQRGFALPLSVVPEFTDNGLDLFINLDKPQQPTDVSQFSSVPRYPLSLSHCTPPTTTFISSTLLDSSTYGSTFCVYLDGTNQIHAESTTFTPIKSEVPGDPFFYTTDFVPQFWSKLISQSAVERYTIIQNVMEFSPPLRIAGSPSRLDRSAHCKLRFSIAYKFKRTPTTNTTSYELCSSFYSTRGFEEPQFASPFSDIPLAGMSDPALLPAYTDLPLQVSHIQNECESPPLWYPATTFIPSISSVSSYPPMATFVDDQYSSLDLSPSYAYPSF